MHYSPVHFKKLYWICNVIQVRTCATHECWRTRFQCVARNSGHLNLRPKNDPRAEHQPHKNANLLWWISLSKVGSALQVYMTKVMSGKTFWKCWSLKFPNIHPPLLFERGYSRTRGKRQNGVRTHLPGLFCKMDIQRTENYRIAMCYFLMLLYLWTGVLHIVSPHWRV